MLLTRTKAQVLLKWPQGPIRPGLSPCVLASQLPAPYLPPCPLTQPHSLHPRDFCPSSLPLTSFSLCSLLREAFLRTPAQHSPSPSLLYFFSLTPFIFHLFICPGSASNHQDTSSARCGFVCFFTAEPTGPWTVLGTQQVTDKYWQSPRMNEQTKFSLWGPSHPLCS